MKCGNCGTEIKYGDRVCSGCGLPLPKSNYKDFEDEIIEEVNGKITPEEDDKTDTDRNNDNNRTENDSKKSKNRTASDSKPDNKKSEKNSKPGSKKSENKKNDPKDEKDILDFDEGLFDMSDIDDPSINISLKKKDSDITADKSGEEKADDSKYKPKEETADDAEDSDDTVDAEDEDISDRSESKKKKRHDLRASEEKLPEAEDIIDAQFVDINEDDSFKAPSTRVKTKHVWTKGDIITVIVGIALLVAIIIAGIIWLVNRQHKKKVEDNRFGKEEVIEFLNGIAEKDEIISYDYVTGNNGDAIFELVDERINFVSGFSKVEIDSVEITDKKELQNSSLDSMINKTGTDLDKAYILDVTFRYHVDDIVLPAKAIIRTGRTKSNKKWWVISVEFDDVISAAQDFMDAYSKLDAEKIIEFYADGVLSDKTKDMWRRIYGITIAPYNFLSVRYKAYKISEDKMNSLAKEFDQKDKKFSAYIGFKVETTAKNSENGSETVDYDLIMALDNGRWRVVNISTAD